MGRYLEAKCRLCRREKMKLFLKGIRCATEKCSFGKRPTPPGTHTRMSSKSSYYCLQLREKQKVKRMYGMLEGQFKRFFKVASKSRGVTGRTLIQLLERRLDNVIYRAIFASSRSQARQFVCHGFAFIGEKRVDIPSYVIKGGDVIEIRANENIKALIRENIKIDSKERSVSSWIEADTENLKIKILRMPERDDLAAPVNEQLIVELYSK
ncbi:MAG: 30S ribosomal protein S4 [Candidatus Omnitrophica bacterium]|nr:30S ribosomal protein S4 [Candidatus Omnitrophota bacterium]MBU0879043.1 30S ribosomal protein S4 [Candidatus Omnitrophota bacterium]MBU0897171.1 30S ribosomal protein S4 [Candidatus Omnitrophota bacterium]MBU1133360.1 30S ribosomal protein S4 [Candidatus Omnitrophota bacterium]MBU1367283.1 30S ribosomal protein S4 [Candidatus Omnitrophota bacterium]